MITIRPYRPQDKSALYEMLGEVWADESPEQLDRRWWWDAAEVPLWLAVEDAGRVAGMCGRIPFAVDHDGERARGAWIVDFFVRAGYQGQGLGKRLVRGIEPGFDFLASLNQTDAAYAAFSRAGWTARRRIPLMLAGSPLAFRASAALQRDAGVTVSVGAARFDAEFDAPYARVPGGITAVRDRGTLSARFTDSPRDYRLARAYRNGALAGYAVMRVLPPGSIRSFGRFPTVMVSDYWAPPEDAAVFRALMRAVARFASASRVRFMLCMTNHARHRRVLAAGGFVTHDTPVIGSRLAKLGVGFTETPSAPAGHWHLTPFDCDLDLLFGARA